MFCSKCGANNEGDAVFCFQCGNRLSGSLIQEKQIGDVRAGSVKEVIDNKETEKKYTNNTMTEAQQKNKTRCNENASLKYMVLFLLGLGFGGFWLLVLPRIYYEAHYYGNLVKVIKYDGFGKLLYSTMELMERINLWMCNLSVVVFVAGIVIGLFKFRIRKSRFDIFVKCWLGLIIATSVFFLMISWIFFSYVGA